MVSTRPVDPVGLTAYAAFPAELDRDWLGRVAHLSEADLAVIRRRTEPVTRLGYATQLATVRAIGTFQADPTAVPGPLVAALARQLDITDPGVLSTYRDLPVRWRHTAEIREAYGYRDFSAQPRRFLFTCWLYRQAFAADVAPSALFRAAHRRLVAGKILLPGRSVLTRLIVAVRERATARIYARLTRAAGPELAARLEKLLRVQRARAIGSEGGGFDGLIALCPQARLRQRVEVPSR